MPTTNEKLTRGPTTSKAILFMPWPLLSSGHHQVWHWLWNKDSVFFQGNSQNTCHSMSGIISITCHMWTFQQDNSVCNNIFFNSSPPSAAYMPQWITSALVQIMDCHLFGTKHYLNQCCVIVNWTLRNKPLWNFNQNTNFFIHENTSENIICKMATILCRGRWIKTSHHA